MASPLQVDSARLWQTLNEFATLGATAGGGVTRLALILDDHVSFVIGEDLIVRKFKLLDGAVDQLEASDTDDIAAELDARFALMAGEFKRLFAVLENAFKLSKADA